MTTYLKPEYCWNGTIQKIQEMKDGKTVQIRGIAARAGETSKNGRHYMRGALMRAVNTFFGVPVTVNHAPLTSEQAKQEGLKFDPNMIVGNVTDMVFDEKTDTLNYAADIKKEPYVTLLRQGSPEIRGVSIQADYQRNKCPDCGKEGFEDKGAFESHMAKEHFKHNIKAGPWGIIGRALSIVFGRETPGLSTTVQLAESAIKGFDSLKETVEVEEERKMENDKLSGKASITTVQTVPWDQMETTSTPPIVEAKTPTQTAQKEPLVTEPKVAEAKPALPNVQTPMEHTRIQLTIVPATLKEVKPPEPSPTAKEKLTLGEPFAGYTDFADCVAKNQEKDNPEAYCGTIKHETEGEMVYRKNVDERLTEVGHAIVLVNTNASEIQTQSLKSMESVAEQTNKALDEVHLRIDGQSKEFRAIQENSKSFAETTAKKVDIEPIINGLAELKSVVDKKADTDSFSKKLAEIEAIVAKKADVEPINKELGETKATLAKKADTESITKELTETKTAFAKTTENLTKLEEKVTSIEEKYKAIVKLAETTNAKNDKTFVELTEENEKLKTQVKDSEEKKVKETAELEVRVDNVEDKLKGTFKGQNKQLEPETTTHTKPEDDMRKTAQRRN